MGGAVNPLRPVAVQLGRQPWLPRFTPQIVTVDHTLQRVTSGRVTLLTLAGLPELVLTVRGRKSGVERRTPLLCAPRDDGWLVAGSNWGMPELPGWAHNLEAADEALVTYRGEDTVVVPRRARRRARRALGGAGAGVAQLRAVRPAHRAGDPGLPVDTEGLRDSPPSGSTEIPAPNRNSPPPRRERIPDRRADPERLLQPGTRTAVRRGRQPARIAECIAS